MKTTSKHGVYKLGWSGIKKETITANNLDTSILRVDDWFTPTIGELCLNSDGNLDVVKDIIFVPAKDPFKAYNLYSFKYSNKTSSESFVERIVVKRGKEYEFRGQTFKYQVATEGDTIDKIAISNYKNPVTNPIQIL